MSTVRRAGFTLVELVLAAGLLSILVLALTRLLDTSMTIWSRVEASRDLTEVASGVLELLASDVHALEGGRRGDLVADWRLFDRDRDGIESSPAPRLRLVRHLDAAGLQRLAAGTGASFETFERGLVEVGWALLPYTGQDPDQRALGTLVRGERRVEERDSLSFFDPGFFGPSGKPVPGSVSEVTGGVLWFSAWFATQTSVLHSGWELGDALEDCASSWDAWNRARPDPEVSVFNLKPAGMPEAKDVPLLPRRVRLELELERPSDLRFRTRILTAMNPEDTTLSVRDGRRLPAVGGHVFVGDEWMRLVAVNGDRATVERGRRGTRARAQAADQLVHHGWRSVREVPVSMTREDWDL